MPSCAQQEPALAAVDDRLVACHLFGVAIEAISEAVE
jgi:hypothetical protein